MTTVAIPDDATGSAATSRPGEVQRLLRTFAATTAVGLGLGFLVGGVGGRLAMRALFLTSDPSVRGLVSDDGFPIGRFDLAATVNLLMVGTVIGVIGAFVYLAVRPFLLGPTWLRRTGCAVGAGAVVGSMLVHTDGVDFTRLGPRWFAVALFVVLPAIYGALAGVYVERAIRPDGWFATTPSWLALLPLAAYLFLPLLVVVGLPVAFVLAVRHLTRVWPTFGRVAGAPAARWVATVAWASVAFLGLWTLAADTVELLATG